MIAAIFRDIVPCSPYVNQSCGGAYQRHLQERKWTKQVTSVQQAVHIRTALRFIVEDDNIRLHPFENLRSYKHKHTLLEECKVRRYMK
jgi:hypothetical protein